MLRRPGLLLQQRQQAFLVRLRQQQLEATLALLQRIEQEVIAQLFGRESFQRFGIAQVAPGLDESMAVVSRCWPSITSNGDWLET
jgi:hypothetical protein